MSDYVETSVRDLENVGIKSSKLEVELLLAHVLGVSREAVMFDLPELTDAQKAEFEALIARRSNREPLSHLLGKREFYGREFQITKDVLDPRPDTETLIDAVLHHPLTTNNQQPITILDIGTGSGCIIITLLKEIPYATGVGIDISLPALEVAKANAKQHNVEDRLALHQCLLADLGSKDNKLSQDRLDIIVSNPPYIPTKDIAHLMPEVYHFEPHIALDGGKDGLDCYRELAKSTHQLLQPNGLIFLEIGAGQADDVVDIFSVSGWQLDNVRNDLAGHERCVIFKPI